MTDCHLADFDEVFSSLGGGLPLHTDYQGGLDTLAKGLLALSLDKYVVCDFVNSDDVKA